MVISQKHKSILYIGLIIFFGMFFSQKIPLVTQDLGRHITNGKIFIETGKIISTNFYSYTEPDFYTLNHHWLSGVFFYIIHKFFNFTGLSIFYLILSGITVFIFFKNAEKKSNFVLALLVTFFLLPLISQRKEIRPEGFSYFFIGLYFYLLNSFTENKISSKLLFPILLISQLIWVNSHIFFIFGIFITAVFTASEYIKSKTRTIKTNKLIILTIYLILISVINPYGIYGVIEPFNIFKEYGYMIAENQSLFFMQKLYPTFTYVYTEIFAFIFLIILFFTYDKKRFIANLPLIILTITFLIFAFKIIRIIPIFGLFLVPFISEALFSYYEDYIKDLSPYFLLILLISLIPNYFFSSLPAGRGLGLVNGINYSAEFFKEQNISGPIFNNYDIGGYLIYHLNGKEKVFVDNRPEAYSVDFFKKTYVPMQENENIWQDLDLKYNFNVIYFYRLDLTPWAQPFLINRIKDSKWIPVFVDGYTLILLKNNDKNKDILEKFSIPKEFFSFKSNE